MNVKKTNTFGILVVKPKGNRSPGSCRFICEYNIKNDVIGAVWGDVNCICLAQNSEKYLGLLNAVVNSRIP